MMFFVCFISIFVVVLESYSKFCVILQPIFVQFEKIQVFEKKII